MECQKVTKVSKNHNKIIQRKLQMRMIKKKNKQDYGQSKTNYNSIIMEYQKIIKTN